MIPAFFPQRLWLVYITGVLEVLSAVGLMLHQFRRLAGVALFCSWSACPAVRRRCSVKRKPCRVDMQSPLVRP
jgi:hypothetical protein